MFNLFENIEVMLRDYLYLRDGDIYFFIAIVL
jgi:hypothetical protein